MDETDNGHHGASHYQAFLQQKQIRYVSDGKILDPSAIHPTLFDFQRDTVLWALKKGRAAIWQQMGLGKTIEMLEWAWHVRGRVLIVAPLAVAQQTVRQARNHLQLTATYIRHPSLMHGNGIYVTNYEMIKAFIGVPLDGIVLDEAAILAHIDGKTRRLLLDHFTSIPFRLACTATPCPNDIAELASQAEFLGVMRREEVLATFFVHDDDGWRLRGHAKDAFFRWLASWAQAMQNPSDLGYDGTPFILPPLEIREQIVETTWTREGELFPGQLKGISDRIAVRRQSIQDRVSRVADLANSADGQVLIWCGLNDEAKACLAAIPDAIEVHGTQPIDTKIERLMGFIDGKYRVLLTKGKIAGHGLNLQNCHRMIFMGVNDSWQMFTQSIGRCWRYLQQHPVTVDIVVTDHEVGIVENLKRKAQEARHLMEGIVDAARTYEQIELGQNPMRDENYTIAEERGENWRILQGDACERLQELPTASVDLSVYSPPFLSLYAYSATERDLGNSRTTEEFFKHFRFIIRELLRVTKPGRETCVHVSQVPAMLVRDGYIGLKDFRGKTIEAFEQAGWIYHGDITVSKSPQFQAIRTHAKGLLFVQLKKDASWLRPGLADYILVFRAPGENMVPILPDISNEDWIEWANPVWWTIHETNTLNGHEARDDEDDRHICPLQLDVVERCIRLWSNPGETVLSPFAGIGSEGVVALQWGRRFIGIELKPLYARTAAKNLREAVVSMSEQGRLEFTREGA